MRRRTGFAMVGLALLAVGAGGAIALRQKPSVPAEVATALVSPAATTTPKPAFASAELATILLAPEPAMTEVPAFARAVTTQAIELCRLTSTGLKPQKLFWDTSGGVETCYWTADLAGALSNLASAPLTDDGLTDCLVTAPEPAAPEVFATEQADPDVPDEDAVEAPGGVMAMPECRPNEQSSLFFTARANSQQIVSARFKLNSSTKRLDVNLDSLLKAFEALIANRHWDIDSGLEAAIASGTDHEVTAVGVRYRFKREFGDVPRFNLTIEFLPDAIDRLSTEYFTPPESRIADPTPGTQTPDAPAADPSGTSAPSDPASL